MRSVDGTEYEPVEATTPTPATTGKYRSWCWTINNYGQSDIDRLDALFAGDTVEYMVFGKECGESGTPHLQGLVVFKSRKTFNSVRDLMPFGTHIECMKGTYSQAADYCKKEGDYKEYVNMT